MATADPLFQWLKTEAPGVLGTKAIKWNFTKFLIGREWAGGRSLCADDQPEDMVKDIEGLLR